MDIVNAYKNMIVNQNVILLKKKKNVVINTSIIIIIIFLVLDPKENREIRDLLVL